MKELWTRALEIVEKPILGNNLGAWGLSVVVGIVVFVAIRVLVRSLARRLGARAEKQGSKLLGFLAEVVGRTSFVTVLLAAVVAATQFVHLPGQIAALMRSLLVVAALLQGGLWTTLILEKWLEYRISTQKQPAGSTAVTLLTFSGKLLLWGFIALMSLQNLGIDVTALIAGLGVGGIAVALATQTLLGDLLGSVVIAIDKPFEVGDLIIVGDLSGSVETIGLKTTRIRSIYGEQIVFANTDLLGSRIRNYKRMSERRVTFHLEIGSHTPVEKLEALPVVIREVVTVHPDLRFERAYFQRFDGSKQVWEVVFYVLSSDIGLHMDRQHQVNLALHKRFLKEGIEIGTSGKAA